MDCETLLRACQSFLRSIFPFNTLAWIDRLTFAMFEAMVDERFSFTPTMLPMINLSACFRSPSMYNFKLAEKDAFIKRDTLLSMAMPRMLLNEFRNDSTDCSDLFLSASTRPFTNGSMASMFSSTLSPDVHDVAFNILFCNAINVAFSLVSCTLDAFETPWIIERRDV